MSKRQTIAFGERAEIASRGLAAVLRLGPAFALFAAGAACQYLTDIFLTARADPADLLLWTQLKPIVFIGGALALAGLEQVVVREPNAPVPLVGLAASVAAAVAAVVAVLAAWLGSPELAIGAGLGTFMFALSNLAFSVARSSGRFMLAHLGRDGWKIVLFGLCVISVAFGRPPKVNILLILAFILGTLPFLFCLQGKRHLATQHSTEIKSRLDAIRVGLPFCISAVSLAIGSYGELLVLNALSPQYIVAEYFKIALIFAYPALMFNTFLSGWLSVKVRENPKFFVMISGLSASTLMMAVTALTILLFATGSCAGLMIGVLNPHAIVVGLLLSLSGSVRLAAVVSTSGLGIVAPRRSLDELAILYFAGSLLMVLAMATLMKVGFYPAIAAAACVASYWTFRLIVARRYSRDIVRRWREAAEADG